MTVQLSEAELKAMSKSADSVHDTVTSMKGVVPKGSDADLNGFQTKDAIDEVAKVWNSKVIVAAADWEYFGLALELTAVHVVDTDDKNAFYFPNTP